MNFFKKKQEIKLDDLNIDKSDKFYYIIQLSDTKTSIIYHIPPCKFNYFRVLTWNDKITGHTYKIDTEFYKTLKPEYKKFLKKILNKDFSFYPEENIFNTFEECESAYLTEMKEIKDKIKESLIKQIEKLQKKIDSL